MRRGSGPSLPKSLAPSGVMHTLATFFQSQLRGAAMRRPISYANVAATLALVFSMSGGALAAKHYLVNSTNQISPKVLKKLKGKTGKTGATGAIGATGATGTTGKEGLPGKEGKE